MNLAQLQWDSDPEVAAVMLSAAQQLRTNVLVQHPDALDVRHDLAKGYINLSRRPNCTSAERLENLRLADEQLQVLVSESGNFTYQKDLAEVTLMQAKLLGETDEAIDMYERSIAVFAAVSRRNPEVHEFAHRLGSSLADLGYIQSRRGNLSDALVTLGKAEKALERLLALKIPSYQRDYAVVLRELAWVRFESDPNDGAESLQLLEKAVEQLRNARAGVVKGASDEEIIDYHEQTTQDYQHSIRQVMAGQQGAVLQRNP